MTTTSKTGKKQATQKSVHARSIKAAKLTRLAERPGTEAEGRAAKAALERLGLTPDDAMWGELLEELPERKRRAQEALQRAREQARQRREQARQSRESVEAAPTRRAKQPQSAKQPKPSVRQNLTELGVSKLKAPKGQQFQNYYDALQPGLVLRVNSGGTKTWVALHYKRRIAKTGKKAGQWISMPVTHELGRYPTLSVKQARDAARKFLINPEKALAQADTGSFREVAETFIKRHVEKEKLRTRNAIVRYLEKHVYEEWGNKKFREIKREDVASLLDQIEDKHGARNADIVLAIIRRMMNWYTERASEYVVPLPRGMKRYNPKDHKRSRTLAKSLGNGKHDDQELRTFWDACGQAGSFGALLKMLLLTGQRLDKVATMRHADISTDGVWTIPTQAREKGNAGSLRLPQLALDIIAAQPRIDGNPYVFPGRVSGRRRKSADGKPPSPPSISGFNQRKREFEKLLPDDMEPWVLHDLRRTARTLLSRAGIISEISERVLGHAIKGVEGVYDRHGYDAEKADALQRLADLVDRIVNPPEGSHPLRG